VVFWGLENHDYGAAKSKIANFISLLKLVGLVCDNAPDVESPDHPHHQIPATVSSLQQNSMILFIDLPIELFQPFLIHLVERTTQLLSIHNLKVSWTVKSMVVSRSEVEYHLIK
jgi:hypothetical protein